MTSPRAQPAPKVASWTPAPRKMLMVLAQRGGSYKYLLISFHFRLRFMENSVFPSMKFERSTYRNYSKMIESNRPFNKGNR